MESYVTITITPESGTIHCDRPLLTSKGKPQQRLIDALSAACQPAYLGVEDPGYSFPDLVVYRDQIDVFLELATEEGWIEKGAIIVKEKAHDPDPHIQIIPVTGDIIPHVPTKPEAPTSDIEARLTRVEQESTEAKKRLDAGFTELKRLDTVLSALESGLPNLLDRQ